MTIDNDGVTGLTEPALLTVRNCTQPMDRSFAAIAIRRAELPVGLADAPHRLAFACGEVLASSSCRTAVAVASKDASANAA